MRKYKERFFINDVNFSKFVTDKYTFNNKWQSKTKYVQFYSENKVFKACQYNLYWKSQKLFTGLNTNSNQN